jgi:Rps23 Pro-64 3,4-dihydroxylase Tpa1-like proline 4-hydroxylase
MIRDDINWDELKNEFKNSKPFNHVIIDNFFIPEIAEQLYLDFPKYEDDAITVFYRNPVENKKALNSWDKFPGATYSAFTFLSRNYFLNRVKFLTGCEELYPDMGLHGGGWHMHGHNSNDSGFLNVHLDYKIHPKLLEERKLNIIIYMTKDWNADWGGELELWSHDEETQQPKEKIKSVECIFNRAILFDTTQNSWHGLPNPIKCPKNEFRRSLAMYYTQPSSEGTNHRKRALFVPKPEQKNDPEILDFIKSRTL